jgi:membrane dipeptidase
MSTQPLLPRTTPEHEVEERPRRGRVITVVVPIMLVLATFGVLIFGERKPSDPVELAKYYLKHTPVIDGHIDLPIAVREAYRNDITKFDLRDKMVRE